MATNVAPYTQGYASSTQSFQVPQAATARATEDPLLTALREYITTGQDASHVTTNELHEIYQNEIAQQGGKASLESLLSTVQLNNQPVEYASWTNRLPMTGNVTITTTKFSFTLTSSESPAVEGSANGVFTTQTSPVLNAMLFYNNIDQLQAGPCTFKMTQRQLKWHIDFSKNGVRIACLIADPVSFIMGPDRNGTGNWLSSSKL